jgi:hypothetical protein
MARDMCTLFGSPSTVWPVILQRGLVNGRPVGPDGMFLGVSHPGPSTLAGGTTGPLGRTAARWGRTTTNRTHIGPCTPTDSAVPCGNPWQAQRAGHCPNPDHRAGTGPHNHVCRPNGPTVSRVTRANRQTAGGNPPRHAPMFADVRRRPETAAMSLSRGAPT